MSSAQVAPAILAIDQGTTNTKALLVEADTGQPLVTAMRPVDIAFPRPGWVEQDAHQLWEATLGAIGDCLDHATDVQIVAVSMANQRESVVCWDRRTGQPLTPVLGWQDARMADWCAELAAARPGLAGLIRLRTGLSLDPIFSAPKMRAALDLVAEAGVDPASVALGTVDSWLVFQLTGQHLIEVGNASRTLLLDLGSLDWDQELLDGFGIPRSVLPQVRASDAGFGVTRSEVGAAAGLPVGLPVVAVLADSHAALYYQDCLRPGLAKATYGTGSSVMTPVPGPAPAPEGIATTVAWQIGDSPTYAREGNILASGSALDWMASVLGAADDPAKGAFLTALAGQVEDAGGVRFVPAFSGLGAPYWDRAATGLVTGVSAGTTSAHLARAALDAVAHQVADVVEAIESDGAVGEVSLRADGGATASRLLMQIQARVLKRPIEVSDLPEASALGAALLAARSLGWSWPDRRARTVISPDRDDTAGDERRAWAEAVARSRADL